MIEAIQRRKQSGAYYTPEGVARSLVRWVVREPGDRLLDPSCGNGQFLEQHPHAVGVEYDAEAAAAASRRAMSGRGRRTVHVEDFFSWAERTTVRFECAAGNPPFIRFQRFKGEVRERARQMCRREGVALSGLASSWLPFLVVTTNLLKRGGRMAFVVPAEIGHATYATSILNYLAGQFGDVRIIAVQRSVFPDLSQDAWLLYAANRGETTDSLSLSAVESFRPTARPPRGIRLALTELAAWKNRLRPWLLTFEERDLYRRLSTTDFSEALGELARVGIGYVSGGNDFFHLRPSEARRLRIPERYLSPTVRNGRSLRSPVVGQETVAEWIQRDEPCLLLNLPKGEPLPACIRKYLDSSEGQRVRTGYKCRKRSPWYVVPDVVTPDAFLSYMSGNGPLLAANEARCVCTNSLHAVRLRRKGDARGMTDRWANPLTQLSCELEGHPLGGGMLKLEPREACRVRIPHAELRLSMTDVETLRAGTDTLRKWRHYA